MRTNFPIPILDPEGFQKVVVSNPDIEVIPFNLGYQINYAELTFQGDPGTYSGATVLGYYTLNGTDPSVGSELGLPIYNGMNIVLQTIAAIKQFKCVAVTTMYLQIQFYNAS